jgi:hypothetical protein
MEYLMEQSRAEQSTLEQPVEVPLLSSLYGVRSTPKNIKSRCREDSQPQWDPLRHSH